MKRQIWIEYTDGTKRQVASEDEAREILGGQYSNAEYCENGWEPNGLGRERLLVWEDKASSENDGGQNAVAEIIREMCKN